MTQTDFETAATIPAAARPAAGGLAGGTLLGLRREQAGALTWLAAGGLAAAGIAAAAAAARWLPLPPGDAFRGTLLILPLILAAFQLIHRWGVRLGGHRLGGQGTAVELIGVAVLALLILSRSHFGLGGCDELLAAGLLLALAHRLVRQVLAARPLLGWRLAGSPSPLFLALPLAAYFAILPWSARHHQPDGDEPYYLMLTHSLAYDGDADLTNNYAAGDWRYFMDKPIRPQPGDPVGPRGEIYSRHNALLPLVLVPAYRLAGRGGALAMMAVMAAALAWTTLRLGRYYAPGHPGEVLVAYALVAFAPPLLLYSYQVWVEVPAALLTMVALGQILALGDRGSARHREGPAAETRPWRRWLPFAAAVLLLPLVKIRFLLISAPLLALAWWRTGRRRGLVLVLGLLFAALAAGILLYNQILYSNPLKIHTWQELDPLGRSPLTSLEGLVGLFYDTAFGLFAYAPIWLLLVPAAFLLLTRRQPPPALPGHLAVLALPYLAVVAPRLEWYGGWSPPFRYALIVLPLLGLALVPLLAARRRPGARALLAGLGALTLVLALVWVTVPGWTYNLANGRTHVLDLLGERLGTDLARFFPSAVRPRAATWIWPLATLAAVPLVWWLPGKRRPLPRPSWTAGLAGTATLLAAAAALPVAAARTPTRVVELEDPQVWKSGGEIYPQLWIIERPLYRGGWTLRVGERLAAPVIAGGRRARLILRAEFIRNQPVPFYLDIGAGQRLLATWTPGRQRIWETVVLGPFDWPAGQPLVLAARGLHPPGELNGVILDRVDFTWQ